MNEAIQSFYQLQGNPFTLTPDLLFYCHLPHYDDVVKTLTYVVEEEDGISLVVAEVGMGKTMLCRKLITALKENQERYHLCYIYNPHHSNEQLSLLIAGEMIENFNKKEQTLFPYQLIQEKVLQYGAQGKKVVIVIDEAQTMSHKNLEFIRLLTNLESDSRKLVKMVLFAQPEIMDRLKKKEMRQLSQRISSINTLRALNYQESTYYIDHRISSAGGCRPVFSEPARKALWKYSKGIPRLINLLASRALLHGFSNKMIEIDKRAVKNARKELTINLYSKNERWKRNVFISTMTALFCAVVAGGTWAIFYHFTR